MKDNVRETMAMEHKPHCWCENRTFLSYNLGFMHDDVHVKESKNSFEIISIGHIVQDVIISFKK